MVVKDRGVGNVSMHSLDKYVFSDSPHLGLQRLTKWQLKRKKKVSSARVMEDSPGYSLVFLSGIIFTFSALDHLPGICPVFLYKHVKVPHEVVTKTVLNFTRLF